MIKVEKIEMENLEYAGCNNGQYPGYTVYFDDGSTYTGFTCRCGHGCSGTDRLPVIGQVFENLQQYRIYSAGESETVQYSKSDNISHQDLLMSLSDTVNALNKVGYPGIADNIQKVIATLKEIWLEEG